MNNFTNIDQSKLLLENGLPIDTADCFYLGDQINIRKGNELESNFFEKTCNDTFPCWSSGQLLEIDLLCKEEDDAVWFFNRNNESSLNNFIFERIVLKLKNNKYDFSRYSKINITRMGATT